MTDKATLPATVERHGQLVQPADAAFVLDEMVLALPALADDDLTPRTIARILSATDEDEIFANPELESLRGLAGRRVYLNDVVGRLPSDYGEEQWYLLYDLTDYETGERMTASSGSPYVASSALRALAVGKLPALVRVLELESKRKAGQSSLWLVSARPDPVPPTNGAAQ